MHDALTRARDAQARASDPGASAFVPASAGSGKTKLLVDRVLRLILAGVDPGRVLCLTFTTAAAAEMDVRLRAVLADWATMEDVALEAVLAGLGVPLDRSDFARTLFARVLDHPGGLRIQNFHSFCQSVLRRFPLEAAISPHFRLLEPLDAEAHRAEARARGVLGADAAHLDLPAAHARDADALAPTLRAFEAYPPAGDHAAVLARLRAALGVTHESDDALLRDAVAWGAQASLGAVIREVHDWRTTKRLADTTTAMLRWLALEHDARCAAWDDWHCAFLTAQHAPRALHTLVHKDNAARPEVRAAYEAEAARLIEVRDQRNALKLAALSASMMALAHPAGAHYRATKRALGGLDFDDLIALSGTLLHDPGAAWVLYKLDGGLDHLLLDEVQDTSPAQWRIAHALADEFFEPGTARAEAGRTVFAVGDRKQSIFGFQGADVDAFEANRARWAHAIGRTGATLVQPDLDVSFRSAPPVLALVDAVFADAGRNAGVGATRHFPAFPDLAGSVTLWPLVPKGQDEPAGDRHARLAAEIAAWIAGRIAGPGGMRHAGDFLILLRNRSPLMGPLIRALKQAGVPVAGADRFALLEQIAVRDLLTLCDVLLLPEDDLSLATVLRSPLCDVDEDALFALAHGRAGTLWNALRERAADRPEWAGALAMLEHLRGLADALPPAALLAEALRWAGGRAKMLARLSAEAAEGIDELLTLALTYAAGNPASLQNFLVWVRAAGAEVKREAEAAGDAVRVMTAHGAKGLQAPVVILPDTPRGPVRDANVVEVGGLPVWVPLTKMGTAATRAAKDARAAARAEEENRLLYVALTRAEAELLVCGAEGKGVCPWHEAASAALAGLGAVSCETPFGPGLGLRAAGRAKEARARRETGGAAPLPGWAGAPGDWTPVPPPAVPARPLPLAPSRPEGAEHGTLPARASPLIDAGDRFGRGTLIHALLQHLPDVPDVPEGARAAAAGAYAARAGDPDAAAEALAVLAHPALAPLFGPGSRAEVPVTGEIAGRVVGGVIDRLLVTDARVLIADFKTNARPPADVAATPRAYVSQLAAYRALLRRIHPGRPVECALIWTRTGTVHVLAEAALDAAEAALVP